MENIVPYFDDARGFYLERKDNSQKEWLKPSETGHMIEGINANIMSLVEDGFELKQAYELYLIFKNKILVYDHQIEKVRQKLQADMIPILRDKEEA